MSYGGFLLDEYLSEAYRAVLSIGTTFNLRRDCAAQIQSKDAIEQFNHGSSAFRQSSWTSITASKDMFQNVMDWLDRKNSVLVSLTIDEQRQKILIWRMSRAGTVCQNLTLAETGPVSYHGIISRMEEVFSLAKNGAAKPGQTFSKQEKIRWWEDYSNLDERMRDVLLDVEKHWLGSEGVSLLTPTILPKAAGAPTSRRSKGRSRSNKHPVVKESSETLVKAFKQLSLRDEFDSHSEAHEVLTGHMILMVDTALERIPWESLPVLRNLSVTASRVPSFSYLYECIREPLEEIDRENLFYLINPEGDLKRTENHFQKVLNQCPTWSGFSGSTKTEAVASKYNGEEIFLYCGHGSGEQYFPPLRLCRKRKAPVALLMGCSSLRPSNLGIGDQESNGTAVNFLIHGAKAVVGNLWDVTDGEVDRLTTSILREWLGVDEDGMHQEQRLSLAEALAKSRPKCKFSYLVGAACVVIGVPHAYATCS
ncbi:Peptidase C50 [Gracilaria domingensis]|nr:Peptidase C50 [Gracilaria domingensis]